MLTQADYDSNDWQTVPFAYPITNALPALTALKLAISDVGDSWQRDSVDERMLTELTSWGALGETINSEYESPMNGPGVVNGGTPYTDTDQDGMPDFWELGTGSNPNVANNNDPSPSGTGYTRLEDYLNWLADPHGVALTNTTVCVDLRQFTAGSPIPTPFIPSPTPPTARSRFSTATLRSLFRPPATSARPVFSSPSWMPTAARSRGR